MSQQPRGLIFDIQGHSIHDGPGTRTLVLMSGCPLACTWCSNPEGQKLRPRLMFNPQLCNGCPQRCVTACPKCAINSCHSEHPDFCHSTRSEESAVRPHVLFNRALCDACDTMDCLQVCYPRALDVCGKWSTVDQVMRVLERDRSYWGSEGGLTLGGGEPLMQKDFVIALLARCRASYISACIETSGYTARATLESVLPLIDWLFIDLKHIDSQRHHAATGVPNELVLDNLRWIASARSTGGWRGRVVVRMAVIPGFNDTIENAAATAALLAGLGLREINLLPFHRLGASKYTRLGLDYEYAGTPALAPSDLELLATIYHARGLSCYLGSDTPF